MRRGNAHIPPLDVSLEGESSKDTNPEKRFSASQTAAMKAASKVLRMDGSPRLGSVIHPNALVRRPSAKKRLEKRRQSHAVLQPLYVFVYFYIPTLLLSVFHMLPWIVNELIPAWRENRVLRTAMDIPWFIERVFYVPNNSLVRSTVYLGVFTIEVTTLVYLTMILLSNVVMFILVRPMLISLIAPKAQFRGSHVD